MYQCKHIGTYSLYELTEKFSEWTNMTDIIQNLKIFIVGKNKTTNNTKIFHIRYVAIATTSDDEENPTMDFFSVNLLGDNDFIWKQIYFLVIKVINTRKERQDVSDIDYF